jgi:hypothetical protein
MHKERTIPRSSQDMFVIQSVTASNSVLNFLQYRLFSQWGDYLGNNSLNPGSQYVDRLQTWRSPLTQLNCRGSPFSLPTEVNQTNIALKGILGVAAMSRVSALLNKTTDSQRYNVRNRISEKSVTGNNLPLLRLSVPEKLYCGNG